MNGIRKIDDVVLAGSATFAEKMTFVVLECSPAFTPPIAARTLYWPSRNRKKEILQTKFLRRSNALQVREPRKSR